MLKKKIAAECIGRIELFVKSMIAVLLCLAIVIGYSPETSAGAIAKVAAEGYHSLLIKPDGSLWAWGRNDYGQLGDGTTTGSSSPVQVGTSTDWVTVISGLYHSLAIKSDGTLWAWGRNDYGQLGDGTTTDKSSPVQVGTSTDWVGVSGGGWHTLGIKSDGTLWTWGYNGNGQLGDGTSTDRHTPVQVGFSTDWVAVTGGGWHTLGIKTDGTLWAWGENGDGRLGDGTTTNRPTPVKVGFSTNWVAVTAGLYHTLGIRTDNTLWAWGYNEFGQLGDGTTANNSSPEQIDSSTDWVVVTVGAYHTLGIKSCGTLWAWGYNEFGQLGDGTSGALANKSSPVQIGTSTNWVAVTAGSYHTLGIKSDDTIWSWGKNNYGQLGDETITPKSSPVPIWHTVAATDGTGGSITPSGSVLVADGDSQTFTVTPDNCYEIDQVLVDSQAVFLSGGTYTFNNVTLNHTINATFKLSIYTITAAAGSGGSISPADNVLVDCGSDKTFTAKPDTGYHFTGWSGDASGTTNPLTITNITSAKTITANFAINTYAVNFIAGANGSITGDTSQTVNHGSSATAVTAMPDTGYHFTGWSGGEFSGTSNPLTISNITAAKTITANFAIDTFNVTVSSTAGGSTDKDGVNVVDYGGSLTITPTPDTGYHFTGWSGDASDAENPLTISNITSDKTITANFAIDTFNVTVSSTGEGSTDKGGVNIVDYDGSLTITPTPDTGYHFTGWSGDASGTANPLIISNVTTDMSISANFEINQYTVTAWAGAGGNIYLSGVITVTYGSSQTFAIAPDDGYHIVDVLIDGVSLVDIVEYAFTNITADHTISATFALKEYKIAVSAGTNGGISPAGSVTVEHGANRVFNITPAEGYHVSDVKVDDVSIGALSSYTFVNILDEHSIDVSFEIDTYTLTTSAGPGGSVFPEGTLTVSHGQNQVIQINPDDGYFIEDVKVDSVSQGPVNSHTFNQINDNHSLYAAFKIMKYTITTSAETGGTIDPLGESTLEHGSSPSFLIKPDDGFEIKAVYMDDIPRYIGDDNTYTLLSISENHTIFATFQEIQKKYTTLSINTSSQAVLINGRLDLTGKLTSLPDTYDNLSILPITITITAPDDTILSPVNTATYDYLGHYEYLNLPGFTQKGKYTIRVSFEGTNWLFPSESKEIQVLAGSQAGYAVIVQGKIPDVDGLAEGLASHNKTTNRIYRKLRERGFREENITYFNYDDTQYGVYDLPVKSEIQWAIETWASGLINGSPAPFYVFLVDHGSVDKFHLDEEYITPAELGAWLDNLEDNLSDEAKSENRIIIIGTCYSGSFIDELSGSGRIILTSATENERSYRGELEPDGIQDGSLFIKNLMLYLGRGYSLKKSFQKTTDITKTRTRKQGESTNSISPPFFDNAEQHPLLEDDGDGEGSYILSEGYGDGQKSDNVYLGVGITLETTNSNTAEIREVSSTVYLEADVTSAAIWLRTYDENLVRAAWVEIRSPVLALETGAGTGQLGIDLEKVTMTFDEENLRWEAAYDSFIESGMYELFYYAVDNVTGEVSSMKRSIVYKYISDNNPPSEFDLVSPLHNSEQGTVLIFNWQESLDPDWDQVSYNLIIAEDASFEQIVYQREEISTTATYVDKAVGLENQKEYYWKIEAVDEYGAKTVSSELFRTFETNNSNVLFSFVTGRLYNKENFNPVDGATITVDNSNEDVISLPNGSFILMVPPGSMSLTITEDNYNDLLLDINVSEDVLLKINLGMDPISSQGPSLNLLNGWNLISLSKQPANTDIETVLDSIVDKYESVWAYINGQWKSHDPEQPFFSDLTTMETGIGYWVRMKEAAELTVSGFEPSGTIVLAHGWNLVGYNGSEVKDMEKALESINGKVVSVWSYVNGQWKSYDPDQPFFSDLNNMTPGVGYWIRTSEAGTWSLP